MKKLKSILFRPGELRQVSEEPFYLYGNEAWQGAGAERFPGFFPFIVLDINREGSRNYKMYRILTPYGVRLAYAVSIAEKSVCKENNV